MAEKKGIFTTLFGGKSMSCCNMEIIEENQSCCGVSNTKSDKKSSCCDMQIIEEDNNTNSKDTDK